MGMVLGIGCEARKSDSSLQTQVYGLFVCLLLGEIEAMSKGLRY